MLLQMLDWKVGFETDFSLSSGKCYKYLKNHLTPMEWEAFMATFSDGSHISTWNALFQACDLFRLVAKEVADHFNYHYSVEEDQNVTAYL
jgi:aminoglycoside 6-adenylyltransferase